MNSFRRDFGQSAEYFVGARAGQRVNDYSDKVQSAIEDCVREMHKIVDNEKDLNRWAKGDVAESWHAGTYNVDVARRGLYPTPSATTPRDRSPTDVRVRVPDGKEVNIQIKNYADPEVNLERINDPKYDGHQRVVPEGHVIDDEHTDRIQAFGAESRPMREPSSRELAEQLRQNGDVDRERFGLTAAAVVQWQDVLREATTAATRAATLGAVLQACPYLLTLARRTWDTGEISAKDLAPLARALPPSLIRSGLAGGLSAAIIGAVRKGALDITRQVDPTVVAAAVVLAIGAFKNSVSATRGEITWPMAATCISEDAIVLASAMGGAAVGQALIPILGFGALVGNILGAALARLAIDRFNEVVLGIAAETGWTVFGLVDQDYTVPGELLEASGWKVLEIRRLTPAPLAIRRVHLRTVQLNEVNMTILRRGVISFGRVAYLR